MYCNCNCYVTLIGTQYLVKWSRLAAGESTWEFASSLDQHCSRLISAYENWYQCSVAADKQVCSDEGKSLHPAPPEESNNDMSIVTCTNHELQPSLSEAESQCESNEQGSHIIGAVGRTGVTVSSQIGSTETTGPGTIPAVIDLTE